MKKEFLEKYHNEILDKSADYAVEQVRSLIEYINKGKREFVFTRGIVLGLIEGVCWTLNKLEDKVVEIPETGIGDLSDGYHTFNQLYHQRAVLFATIVNQNQSKSWKSWKHEDGKYCFDSDGEWFIVGVDTPDGSYTYHYQKEYWDMFKCPELQCGKHWDGHTEKDVIRLLSLV